MEVSLTHSIFGEGAVVRVTNAKVLCSLATLGAIPYDLRIKILFVF